MSTPGFIDFARTREALDFKLVLQHYGITSTGGGDQLKIHCPFHDPDSNPSCGVNVVKRAFNCFSCQTKGNILEFVALMEDLDPENMVELKQAAERALKDIMGLNPQDFQKPVNAPEKPQNASGRPKSSKDDTTIAPTPKRRPTGFTARNTARSTTDEPAQTRTRENPVLDLELPLDPEHNFFEEHGISIEMVETFGLGYCGRGLMKGRIAIPIHNEAGKLVAYAGRYPAQDVPVGTERYKLPKRFYKSLVLFNLHRAQAIGGRHLVIVEGYWSTMRLHLARVPCVACLGTAISEEQAELVKAAGFRYVTVIFDGDEPGRTGLDGALPILGKAGLYARALMLDEGVKPDTMPEQLVASLKPSMQS